MNAASTVVPCLETPIQKPAATKPQTEDQPVKPWFTPEQMAAVAAKQPRVSSEEMGELIHRTL